MPKLIPKAIEPKKEHKPKNPLKIKESQQLVEKEVSKLKTPTPITTTIKDQIVTWMKSLDPNIASNNEVKRYRQKDGYFRESHVRGFIDLINIFFENYDIIVEELKKKGLILNEFIEKGFN